MGRGARTAKKGVPDSNASKEQAIAALKQAKERRSAAVLLLEEQRRQMERDLPVDVANEGIAWRVRACWQRALGDLDWARRVDRLAYRISCLHKREHLDGKDQLLLSSIEKSAQSLSDEASELSRQADHVIKFIGRICEGEPRSSEAEQTALVNIAVVHPDLAEAIVASRLRAAETTELARLLHLESLRMRDDVRTRWSSIALSATKPRTAAAIERKIRISSGLVEDRLARGTASSCEAIEEAHAALDVTMTALAKESREVVRKRTRALSRACWEAAGTYIEESFRRGPPRTPKQSAAMEDLRKRIERLARGRVGSRRRARLPSLALIVPVLRALLRADSLHDPPEMDSAGRNV